MKAISIKIPDPLFHDLTVQAKANAISQSEVIRSALSMYLHQSQASEAVSCAQQASRWIGSVDGPSDLSTNAGHLAGFGQSDPASGNAFGLWRNRKEDGLAYQQRMREA